MRYTPFVRLDAALRGLGTRRGMMVRRLRRIVRDRRARGDPGRPLLPGDVRVVGSVHRPGGTACAYAAPPRSGPGAEPGGGIRNARLTTCSRRGDGTATGQLASAQTVRPG